MNVEHTTQSIYTTQFTGNEEIQEKALSKAWEIRNFEIEMYWKRALYFWAFIASTFTGYLALVGSSSYVTAQVNFVEYLLICLGVLLSLAWILANTGSKTWQENWELHIDLLENNITGKLYKTVLYEKTYSVSGINMWVSRIVFLSWILLAANYWQKNWVKLYENSASCCPIILLTLGAVGVAAAMYFSKSFTHSKYGTPNIEFSKNTKQMTTRQYELD